MQFIENGPDIPLPLLQAQEEGRVVFFCGAGISCAAGLPTFKELTENICEILGAKFTPEEKHSFDQGQYDIVLNQLEQRFPGKHRAVRSVLKQALQPRSSKECVSGKDLKSALEEALKDALDDTLKGALEEALKGVSEKDLEEALKDALDGVLSDVVKNLQALPQPERDRESESDCALENHRALLHLGRDRKGALRIVTTNFDRLFHKAAPSSQKALREFVAPLLPIPRDHSWNGIVFLHGLLPEDEDETALNNLVMTSGDFGRAYLKDAWAARFVSELFQNYVVCFVGYSMNDPIMRYMMAAFAAEKMQGAKQIEAYAFVAQGKSADKTKTVWESQGITPILYDSQSGHDYLTQTLQKWADLYHDGIQGKVKIIAEYASHPPQKSTKQDDFSGRVFWALSDPSGLPAQHFANFAPTPDLKWLLDTDHSLAAGLFGSGQWNEILRHWGRWLTRHLNDPRLLNWVVDRGGRVHPSWAKQIEKELNRPTPVKKQSTSLQQSTASGSPTPVELHPHMRTLWRLLLGKRIKISNKLQPDIYAWKERLKRDGLTLPLRFELRQLLSPHVKLSPPPSWAPSLEKPTSPEGFFVLEIVPASDSIPSALYQLSDQHWSAALPDLLEELQQLLIDTLILLSELTTMGFSYSPIHAVLPCISSQSHHPAPRDWIILAQLLRDSWLALFQQDKTKAASYAQAWLEHPEPTFKRFALFAASQDNCISPQQWTDWLFSEGASLLWSSETQREVCRLLALQGKHLDGATQKRLEEALLTGPQNKAEQNPSPQDPEWATWLRLAKLQSSGLTLGEQAKTRLEELSQTNPSWQLSPNEEEEFPLGRGSTDEPGYEQFFCPPIPSTQLGDVIQWLKQTSTEKNPATTGRMFHFCKKHPFKTLCALSSLADEGQLADEAKWPTPHWKLALRVWEEKRKVRRSWRYAAPLVQRMPDSVLRELALPLASWLRAAAETLSHHEDIFLQLCERLLNTENLQNHADPQTLSEALYYPTGGIALALLNYQLRTTPNDHQLLDEKLKPLFNRICDVSVSQLRPGRIALCSHLVTLFRMDREWTSEHLLPLLNWETPEEAKAAWLGFLAGAPRLHPPLLSAIKPQFLETAQHYAELGTVQQRFLSFFTWAALHLSDGYTLDDFQESWHKLPPSALQGAALALSRALNNTSEPREAFWKNRVQPLWHKCWPKFEDAKAPQLAGQLIRMALAARGEFPSVVKEVEHWLVPIQYPAREMQLLLDSQLCQRFPDEALQVLSKVTPCPPQAPPPVLEDCLTAISQGKPELEQNADYTRLRDYCRMQR